MLRYIEVERTARTVRSTDQEVAVAGRNTTTDEAQPGSPWVSLITHFSQEDPEQLLGNPYNWRIHETHQRSAMAAALDEIGWAGAVIVNDTTGNVIDGHMRVELALSRGETQVPVLHLAATEEQEHLILATFDPIGALAVADREKLKELSANLQPQQAALQTMLQDLALRYRDSQVSENFQNFLENRSGTGYDEAGTGEQEGGVDDGFGESDGADPEGAYFPVTYSLTGQQRAVVMQAIKKARTASDAVSSADALVYLCQQYLDG